MFQNVWWNKLYFSSLFHQAMPSGGTRLIVGRAMVVRMGGGWWGSLIIFQGSGFQTWISCYLPISYQGWEFVCFPSPTLLISYLARALLVCVVSKYKTLRSYVHMYYWDVYVCRSSWPIVMWTVHLYCWQLKTKNV